MYSKLLLNKKKIMFILAIGAGALLGSPNVYALEEQVGYYTSGVEFERSDNTLSITSKNKNNVINWESFDVGENSTVKFDKGLKENNYLNLIHDTKASEIYGNIEGGNNVYLINPNGILFGANSNVNVGNLYVSTRPLDGNDFADYVNSDGFLNATTNLTGNIVNLGKMQATQVLLEGNSVTLTSNIPDISKVVVKAPKNINLVFNDGEPAKEVNNNQFKNDISNNLSDLLKDDSRKISFQNLNGKLQTDFTPYYLIRNVYELQNMQNNLKGNFMLACDIDAATTKDWNNGSGFTPIGIRQYIESKDFFVSPYTGRSYYETVQTQLDSPFAGKFNGLNYTIKDLYINRPEEDYIGLFGLTEKCEINNVNMVDSKIKGGHYVGGVAGYNNQGDIKGNNSGNVSGMYVGGLVGFNDDGQVVGINKGNVDGIVLLEDYSNSQVGSRQIEGPTDYVGGLVGYSGRRSPSVGIERGNVTGINYGNVSGNSSVGGLVGTNDAVVTGYNTGNATGKEAVGSLVGESYGTVKESSDLPEVKWVNNSVNSDLPIAISNDISEKQPVNGIVTDGKSGTQPINVIDLKGNLGRLPLNGFKIEVLSEKLPTVGKFIDKKQLPTDERLLEEQPMVENNFSYGVKIADCINQSNSRDFQNFSKGSSLVGETIQVTKDDEETVSSRKKLILKE